eukprot:3840190-Prymnesium_polylepis.1
MAAPSCSIQVSGSKSGDPNRRAHALHSMSGRLRGSKGASRIPTPSAVFPPFSSCSATQLLLNGFSSCTSARTATLVTLAVM